MKATTTEHMKAKCGHNDILGYLMDTYCKACADKGHRMVVRPTIRTSTQRKTKVKP
jgi:hypothetical protein